MAIVDVVKWDAWPGVYAWKFPSSELSNKTRLIVAESQEAVLLKNGEAVGPFGPGVHVLNTQNYPVLISFIKMATGGVTPFTAEVWFVSKTFKLDIKWGTTSAIQVEDPKYHIILPVRAFGQYGLMVRDTSRFLLSLVGSLPAFVERTLVEYFRGIILTQVKDLIGKYLVEKNISVLQLTAHLGEISEAAEQRIAAELDSYGLELVHFQVNSISTDERDPAVARLRQALAQKAEMDIIGYSYQQKRSFDTLQTAAGNQAAGGAMNAGIGMAMGMGMGMPMGQTMHGMAAANFQTQAQKSCPACKTQVAEDAAFCPSCGQSLKVQAGACCVKCGQSIPAGCKFCPGCGAPQQKCCPHCGKGVNPGMSFCPDCGAKID